MEIGGSGIGMTNLGFIMRGTGVGGVDILGVENFGGGPVGDEMIFVIAGMGVNISDFGVTEVVT